MCLLSVLVTSESVMQSETKHKKLNVYDVIAVKSLLGPSHC